jgi:hypothetical protein
MNKEDNVRMKFLVIQSSLYFDEIKEIAGKENNAALLYPIKQVIRYMRNFCDAMQKITKEGMN